MESASTFLKDLVACTAEIRQMRRQDDGSVYIVAKGRQRVVRIKESGALATQAWDAAVSLTHRLSQHGCERDIFFKEIWVY
jgi:hypothetical protein